MINLSVIKPVNDDLENESFDTNASFILPKLKHVKC